MSTEPDIHWSLCLTDILIVFLAFGAFNKVDYISSSAVGLCWCVKGLMIG